MARLDLHFMQMKDQKPIRKLLQWQVKMMKRWTWAMLVRMENRHVQGVIGMEPGD